MLIYRMLSSLVALCAVIACKNPEYCAGNPHNDCRLMWDAAGPMTCTGDLDCMAPTRVCDLGGTHTCVQCTMSAPGACTGATPACVNNECQKCTVHSQCATSSVCLPDGTCADAQQVAYVAGGGSGSTCIKTNPCGTLDAGLKTHKPFVKIAAGMVADNNITTIDGQAVTILADRGAQLSRTTSGVILQVQNDGADAKILDLEITGGTGLANAAVSIPNGGAPKLALTRVTVDANQGIGISVAAGTLTVIRSTISNNSSGGISVSGATSIFDISDSFIVHNGHATNQLSLIGGAALTTVAAGSRFEWNTVAFNESDGNTFRGGVSCNVPLATAGGNLLYHNSEPDGQGGTKSDSTTQKNVSGCQYGNTLAITTDPNNLGFKSPLTMPFDFHLTSTTPATIINTGGMCSGEDFDGQSRPIGTACDLGADEYQPTP